MAIPSISYNLGVPNPPNNPSVDVTPMQQNTNAISQFVSVDHIGFGVTTPAGLSGSGAHLQVNLANTATSGTPVIAPTRGGTGYEVLYSSAVNPANTPIANASTPFVNSGEILFTRGAGGVQIQLTGPGTPYVELLAGVFSRGGTFLPGGIILQCGFSAINAGTVSTTTITFDQPFPNNLFFVFAQPTAGSSHLAGTGYFTNGGNLTDFDFNIVNPTGISNFSWFAIGN